MKEKQEIIELDLTLEETLFFIKEYCLTKEDFEESDSEEVYKNKEKLKEKLKNITDNNGIVGVVDIIKKYNNYRNVLTFTEYDEPQIFTQIKLENDLEIVIPSSLNEFLRHGKIDKNNINTVCNIINKINIK